MKKGKKWYKSFGNWLIVVACIILVPILIANIFIIVQSKTNKNKVPSVFGYKPFIVLSGSMEGKIHKGDLIITKEVDPTTLKINDIIAFRDAENTVTTHRIIDIVQSDGTTKFITKGDNNSTQDRNLVDLEDVEGLYVTRISSFGSLMSSLSKPTTILSLGFIITLIFIIGFAISIKKEKKLEREEYLKFKMMKEEQESERKRNEPDEVLNLRKEIEQPRYSLSDEDILGLRKEREQPKYQYESEDLLRLKREREQQELEKQRREREELLRLKRLKEEQEHQMYRYDDEDLLRLRREREQQERMRQQEEKDRLLKLKIIRELQDRGFSKSEILELLHSREGKERESNPEDKYKY